MRDYRHSCSLARAHTRTEAGLVSLDNKDAFTSLWKHQQQQVCSRGPLNFWLAALAVNHLAPGPQPKYSSNTTGTIWENRQTNKQKKRRKIKTNKWCMRETTAFLFIYSMMPFKKIISDSCGDHVKQAQPDSRVGETCKWHGAEAASRATRPQGRHLW